MSSIFGQLNFHQQPIEESNLSLVEKTLNHWQADDSGLWFSTCIGMGHLMLHNTPESINEHLPLHNSESQLTITADARIDNREELFSKLEIRKEIQQTIPDSSLILLAYKKFGKECVKHLIGDFAFAIWDEREQSLFCARDHMGVKPFFYYQDLHFFAFASEKKGILVLPEANQEINKQFYFNLLIRPSVQELGTTLYQHIKRLEPAQTLMVQANSSKITLSKYWELDAETVISFHQREDYYEGLLQHFKESVKCRTRSIFDVGAQLSGGMDSSAITGVAAALLRSEGKELITLANTLSKDVTDPKITKLDERKYIDEVNLFNNIQNPLFITEKANRNLLDGLDFSLYVNDGIENWECNWLIPLKEKAFKNNIRTLLSGFPGDELVTYRGKYYFLDYLDKKQYLKYWLAKKKFPGFHKLEPFVPFEIKKWIHELKIWLHRYDSSISSNLELFYIPNKYLRHKNDATWISPSFSEQFKSYRYYQKFRLHQPHTSQRMESETRMGLYFRTEPRFPMADIRLTQYYLSMPNELKYEGTLARTAFRKAMHTYLPPLILERDSKYGSIAPFLSVDKLDFEAIRGMVNAIPEHPNVLKSAILDRINYCERQMEVDREKLSYKDRLKAKLPNLELLRWMEKNQGKI